jgi:hypothetical protein
MILNRQNLSPRLQALQGKSRSLRSMWGGDRRSVWSRKSSRGGSGFVGALKRTIANQLHPIEEESSDCDSKLLFEEDFADVVSMDEDDSYNIRSGLEKLVDAMKVPENTACPKQNVVTYAIIYGGEDGSPEERLRCCIQTFVCAEVNQNDNGSSSFFFDSFHTIKPTKNSDYDDDDEAF